MKELFPLYTDIMPNLILGAIQYYAYYRSNSYDTMPHAKGIKKSDANQYK